MKTDVCGTAKTADQRAPVYDYGLWRVLETLCYRPAQHGADSNVAVQLNGDPVAFASHFATSSAWLAICATSVHTISYLIVTGAIAALVFEKFGVNFLRKAWINVDLVWAAALILTGVANVFIWSVESTCANAD